MNREQLYIIITNYNRRLEEAAAKLSGDSPKGIRQALSDFMLACKGEAVGAFLEQPMEVLK